jgi:hypothetical protein
MRFDAADLCVGASHGDKYCIGFPILRDSWFFHVVNSHNVLRNNKTG